MEQKAQVKIAIKLYYCTSVHIIYIYDKNQIPFGLVCLGLFFILPCIDSYQKVDLRVVSFDVPPQEASFKILFTMAVAKRLFTKWQQLYFLNPIPANWQLYLPFDGASIIGENYGNFSLIDF